MKYTILLALLYITALVSCKKDTIDSPPTQDPLNDARTILLKDMIVQNLPSPYYHFDYDDSGFITHVNYQSGLAFYDLSYQNGRIDKMMDNTFVNKTRLQYTYKDGKVSQINFQDNAGVFYKQVTLSYNSSSQLTEAEWDVVNADGSFTPEQTIELEYYSDGNLAKVNHHDLEIPGIQPEAFYTDTYENYDTKTNVDAFAILHKINDHLFLLPNITIQKNNPLKETRTGDGLNYTVNYTYTYNDSLPVRKDADLLVLNGDNAGMHINYFTSFSYY